MMKAIFRKVKKGNEFFLKNDYFDFFEKLKVAVAKDRAAVVRELIMKRLSEANDGARFFSLGGYKIHFQPDYRVIDKKYFLNGITAVLAEAFFFSDYCNSRVYVKRGDVVLDIGANIGVQSLLFSKLVGKDGKVFSFEPVTHAVLSINIEKNDINNVIVVPKGISNEVGTGEIEVSDYCLDSSIARREYTRGYYTHKRVIDLISLDIFAEEMGLEKIDFIKMDIEGVEELAIRGAKEVIKRYRPVWSISSYHIDMDNEPQHDKLVSLLKSYDYRIEEIKGQHIYAW